MIPSPTSNLDPAYEYFMKSFRGENELNNTTHLFLFQLANRDSREQVCKPQTQHALCLPMQLHFVYFHDGLHEIAEIREVCLCETYFLCPACF